MKIIRCFVAVSCLIFSFVRAQEVSTLELIKGDFALAQQQYKLLLTKASSTSLLPRSFDKGEHKLVKYEDWTSGFFPGTLWYLYEYTHDEEWKKAAIEFTNQVEPAKFLKSHHDIGFILNSSFGNGYRLGVNKEHYRDVIITGATTLATRFNPKVGAIKSWDNNPKWGNPVIIDNMMNLELLNLATTLSGDPWYQAIALQHANTTLSNHFRDDYSSYHVVNFDPNTGAVLSKQTHQGFADHSSWARGQAWGLYGFTMMYRTSRDKRFKDQAQNIAEYLLSNPKIPSDGVPFWDFDDSSIPKSPRDSSAAAIMSSALLELSQYVDQTTSRRYISFAEKQIKTLSSSNYLAVFGENGGFLLKHATGNKPNNSEVDVPLNYGDYYFLEALLRLEKINHQ